MGKGREWFWEPGEEKARALRERGKTGELCGDWTPNRSMKPALGNTTGRKLENKYLPTLLTQVFPSNLLLLLSIGSALLEARGLETPFMLSRQLEQIGEGRGVDQGRKLEIFSSVTRSTHSNLGAHLPLPRHLP